MNIKEFSKETLAITPAIHARFVKGLPESLIKGRITLAHTVILDMLSIKKECRMSDISKSLGVTKGAVTGFADRLIKTGFLRRARSKSDRRVVNVTLTKNGLAISKKITDYRLKLIKNLFVGISSKERAQYIAILRKIKVAAEGKVRL